MCGFEEIIAIDRVAKANEKVAWKKTQKRLDGRGIRFIKGSGSPIIQKILRDEEEKKTAIFIDGPKGKDACKMGKRFFRNDMVRVVGLHDQDKLMFDHLMSVYFEDVFFTDASWFRKRYSHLDEGDNKVNIGKNLTLGKSLPRGAVIGISHKD